MSEPHEPVTVSRKENPLAQGAKYGLTGCAGCVTFAVIALLALIVLAALAHH